MAIITVGFILLAIPEECFAEPPRKNIWGSNNPKATGNEYVLPEYVLGFVPQNYTIDGEDEYFNNRHIIYNQEENRAKYQYFFKNGTKGILINSDEREI